MPQRRHAPARYGQKFWGHSTLRHMAPAVKKKKKSGGDESIYTGYSRSQVSLKIIVRATLGVKDKD